MSETRIKIYYKTYRPTWKKCVAITDYKTFFTIRDFFGTVDYSVINETEEAILESENQTRNSKN